MTKTFEIFICFFVVDRNLEYYDTFLIVVFRFYVIMHTYNTFHGFMWFAFSILFDELIHLVFEKL